MRDTKSLLLLLVSLLLVLVSFVLIWTWGYNFYSKNVVDRPPVTKGSADSAFIAEKVADSLNRFYAKALKDLDIQFDSSLIHSDSLSAQLDYKLAEFYRLKAEISSILQNRNTGNAFASAREKIGELQSKVDRLRDKSADIDQENTQLHKVMNDLNRNEKQSVTNSLPPGTVPDIPQQKMNAAYSPFTASDIHLVAVTNDHEAETMVAEKAAKLTGAFSVTNFNSALTNAEVMVAVIAPDGKVLKGTGWDSGTFNTPAGKKIYSYKFNFVYTRGEAKRLAFSLRTVGLSKGTYSMEVYQNGMVIARIFKTLS